MLPPCLMRYADAATPADYAAFCHMTAITPLMPLYATLRFHMMPALYLPLAAAADYLRHAAAIR